MSRTVFFNGTHVLEKKPQATMTRKGEEKRKEVTPMLVTLVANALKNDKLLTVKLLETKFHVSYGTMHTIFTRVFK